MVKRILLYFSIKYNGDFTLMYEAIKKKEKIDLNLLSQYEKNLNCKYITILDEDYPINFKRIPNPPFVLYYLGDLSILKNDKKISIIGKRNNTEYGKKMTEKIILELKEYNPCIISGLARGIDKIAHFEAMKNNLPTIAILGSGINYCYPIDNIDIYNNIKEKGLIISEYPNDLKPERKNFLIRNRLIAALGDSILIVEANIKSGTMNTTSYALEYGKDVCCVPTSALENSGCNFLIKQGAKLVECAKDIYE